MIASKRRIGDDVSLNTILQDIEGAPVYAVVLKWADANKVNTKTSKQVNIQKLMYDFKDLFPKELLRGPPPSIIQLDFKINMKGGANPVKWKLYRTSNAEIDEL